MKAKYNVNRHHGLTAAGLGICITALLLLSAINISGQSETEKIKSTFRNPGPENRPWVYWYVMDGHINKDGIKSGLEAMNRAGIGGVVFMEVDQGLEKGPVQFMSAEWRDCFKYAAEEAERLGMELTVGSGPGWAGSGGPWIRVEDSMLSLVSSSVDVSGNVDMILPQPQPETPFFGIESLDEKMKESRKNFYRDVCVLAYPKVENRTPVDHHRERALYIRRPFSSDDEALPMISMPEPADVKSNATGLDPSQMIDLTSYLRPDGRLVWTTPGGDWTIYRFGITTTGANTRPAPASGYGFECSKLDSSVFDTHFMNFHKKLLDDLNLPVTGVKRTKGWDMLHIDSWEMGAQNWSYNFPVEFRKRRGYDMTPFLPAYSGQIVKNRQITERFLWDMRMTAQELMIENYAMHFKKLAHKYGMGLSLEPYDMNPASDLALGAVADVPMCEYWVSPFITAFSCMEAVSVAHTNNRNIVAAESMTGGQSPAWADNPGNMKNQVDWALACGINRMAFHVVVLQPYSDRFPGMTLGNIGSFYNTTQTWWNLSGSWHEYLTRCQYLLRQGNPVADILYLTPEGAPVDFLPPESATSGTNIMPDRKGFNFDGCDPLNLIANADVKAGKIVFPGGMEYRVLVLPYNKYMTPELLKKINELIEKGATVTGFAPEKSPSLVNYPECDKEVTLLSEKMWGSDNSPKKIGKGTLYPCTAKDTSQFVAVSDHGWGKIPLVPPYISYESVADILHKMGIKEDFSCDRPFRYVHRRLQNGDVYFLSNTQAAGETGLCTFRARGRSVTLLNPVDGKEYNAEKISQDSLTTTLKIKLDPHGSVFVLFDDSDGSKKDLPGMAPELKVIKEVKTQWTVSFSPDYGKSFNATYRNLTDWSSNPDSTIKYYSGTAKYVTDISLTGSETEGRTFLDLGSVGVIAGIRINGKFMGEVWSTPYKIEATGILKPGINRIEIEVANLWVNRLIGDRLLPENRRYTWTTCNPFKGTDKLWPSGLIGPVTIQKAEEKNH